jgi:hypothetical protein
MLSLSWAMLLASAASAPPLHAQRFEVVDRSGLVAADIEVASGRLLVYQRSGERIYYSRDVRFDSADRGFVGYLNLALNRVLRFPRSGSGILQTADLDDLIPRFRNTSGVVRAVGGRAGGRPLHGEAWHGEAWHGGAWHGGHTPIIPGYTPYIDPYVTGYRGAGPPAQSVLIDSQTVPNGPLPPARVVFRNDGPRELQVGVIDLKNPSGTRSMRIRPAAAAEIELARDAGAKRISHYRVVTPFGESITKELVTEIPPSIRYEVVVHEWAIQSVAIDRTGKSPNPIEDINFQGRGLGRFPLPPGPELQSGTIEVYRAARSRGNAGSVAPIVPPEDLPSDPLERAILEAQQAAQRN